MASLYKIIHFNNDDTVECVPKSWLEDTVNGTVCYWPLKDAKRCIKSYSLPDKELWARYNVRCLGKREYGDYSMARKYLKKAEDTSNFESEEECETRKKKKPSRFENNSDIESDEGEEKRQKDQTNVRNIKKQTRTEQFPLPLSPCIRIRSSMTRSPSPFGSAIRQGAFSPSPTPSQYEPETIQQGTINLSAAHLQHVPESPTSSQHIPASPASSTMSSVIPPLYHAENVQDQDKFTQVLDHLKRMETKVDEIRKALNLDDDRDDETLINNFLPNGKKADTEEDMATLVKKLEGSEETRKFIVRSLANLQRGEDTGLICRTIMRSLMSNKLMSLYSVRGQKGKLSFSETIVFKIVLKSVRRACRGKMSVADVKLEIGEVLRNAPNQPGGRNYVKKQQNKEKPGKTKMAIASIEDATSDEESDL